MIVPILKLGASELRKVSEPVTDFNGELEEIARNMIETMYGASGIGLAAPQIGINIRLVTIDPTVGEDKDKTIVICNPEIVTSEGRQSGQEGCLSIPNFSENVERPMKMVVQGRDLKGEGVRFEAEGILSRCFCHEIDHINGVLFIDHLSALKRTLIRNKIKKLAKAGEW
ncbi:MAG: peptide deformylase [Acidobacteria bacterium]|nr:peptide deformylase [Acidobacteriota bacterium]